MNVNFKSLLKALLISVITMAVLLFIFAFVALKSNDSTKNLELYGRIVFFASAFAGCFYAVRSSDTSPLITALIYGGIYALVSFALSLALGGGNISKLWLPYLSLVAVSFAAALFGSRKKPKKPKGLKAFKKQKSK